VEQAVEHVVAVMRNQYCERLSVPDLAAETFFSPFHFSRIFRRETGVTPCQYLTAVRLFEAKRMLLTTSLNVADIACRVGYPGVGTFTTRFSRLVGMSPGNYRRLPPEGMLAIVDGAGRLPSRDLVPITSIRQPRSERSGGTVIVSVYCRSAARPGRVIVGVFDDLVPQGPPVSWMLVPAADGAQWRLDGLPAGRWVVIAVAEGHSTAQLNQTGPSIFVGVGSPVEVATGTTVQLDLELRRPRWTDPPIMVALGGQTQASRLLAS
jgi:AraC family transcriptional regulator